MRSVNNMDLLLSLKEPGRLLVGNDFQRKTLSSRGLYSGQMPWWVQSDVLFTQDREFVGIVLYAGESDAATAHRFAAASDPKIVRYLSAGEAVKLPRYRGLLDSNVSVLELRWSLTEPADQVIMQLNDDWYYPTACPASDDFPCAWGYSGIEDILASEGLKLPDSHF